MVGLGLRSPVVRALNSDHWNTLGGIRITDFQLQTQLYLWTVFQSESMASKHTRADEVSPAKSEASSVTLGSNDTSSPSSKKSSPGGSTIELLSSPNSVITISYHLRSHLTRWTLG